MHILLIAEESVGINFIRYLHQSTPHQITVMASPRRQILSGATTWLVAEQLGLSRIPAKDIKCPNFHQELKNRAVDVLISIRSRYIVPEQVINTPPLGSFNLHTGPLPQYSGINVINWAIYNGERRHSVTLHHMNKEIDSGEIAYTAEVDIDPDESAASLTKKCFRGALSLLKSLVSDLESAQTSVPAIEQDSSLRRWYGPEVPHNGFVPWSEGAYRAYNFIRACNYFPFPSPWGVAKALQDGEEIGILKARKLNEHSSLPPGYVGESSDSGTLISAGDYWIIVEEVMVDDDRALPCDIFRSGSVLQNF